MASQCTTKRLKSLQITLPFSVVQVWNDLEIGQVVKLPATDESDDEMSLHAQRDGSNNISLRFLHKHLASIADTYSADIHIRKVSLAKLDSSSVPKNMPSAASSGQIIPQTTSPHMYGTSAHSQTQPPWNLLNTSNTNSGCNGGQPEPAPVTPPGGSLSPTTCHTGILEPPSEYTESRETCSVPLVVSPPTADTALKNGSCDPNHDLIGLPRVAIAMSKSQSAAVSTAMSAATTSTQSHDLKPSVIEITPNLKVHKQQPQPKDLSRGPLRPPPPLILVRPASKNSPQNPAKRLAVDESQVRKDTGSSMSTETKSSGNEPAGATPEDAGKVGNDAGSQGTLALTKKTRGPRQYKCDICGAEFVYAGVYSKHMWKHSKYSKSQHPNSNILVQALGSQNVQLALMAKPPGRGGQVPVTAMPPGGTTRTGGGGGHVTSHQQPITVAVPKTAQSVVVTTAQVDCKLPVLAQNGNHPANGDMPFHALPPSETDCSYGNGMAMDQSEESYGEESLDGIHLEEDDGITEVHLEKRDGPVDCWICGRPFTYRAPFMRHMRSAHDIRIIFDDNRVSNKTGKVFTCKICSQSFLYQLPFEKHMKSIHGVDLETTPTKHMTLHDQNTGQMFTGSEAINIPVLSHTNMLSHDSFSQVLPSAHVLTARNCQENTHHSSTSANIAKDNDYMLIDSSGNRVMFGEKLQCSVCGQSFSEKRRYMEHMQNEHGIQPREENSPFKAVGTKTGKVFTCHLCQRRFSYKGPYEKHMRSHGINLVVLEKEVTNESLYCEICGKVFAYQLPYEKHMRKSHGINVPSLDSERAVFLGQQQLYQCDICFATFAMLKSLVKHISKRHKTFLNGGARRQSLVSGREEKKDAQQREMSGLEDSDSDSETGAHRAYLDPYTIVEDAHSVQHQLQYEDQLNGTQDSDEEPLEAMDMSSSSRAKALREDREETKLEPDRVQQPGSSLSLIKCGSCEKMFRYQIAFSKHMQTAHPESVTETKLLSDDDDTNEKDPLSNQGSEEGSDWQSATLEQDRGVEGKEEEQEQDEEEEMEEEQDKPVDYTTQKRSITENHTSPHEPPSNKNTNNNNSSNRNNNNNNNNNNSITPPPQHNGHQSVPENLSQGQNKRELPEPMSDIPTQG